MVLGKFCQASKASNKVSLPFRTGKFCQLSEADCNFSLPFFKVSFVN